MQSIVLLVGEYDVVGCSSSAVCHGRLQFFLFLFNI